MALNQLMSRFLAGHGMGYGEGYFLGDDSVLCL